MNIKATHLFIILIVCSTWLLKGCYYDNSGRIHNATIQQAMSFPIAPLHSTCYSMMLTSNAPVGSEKYFRALWERHTIKC